jgi:drug/metabolite transporter (DMT)-like permease
MGSLLVLLAGVFLGTIPALAKQAYQNHFSPAEVIGCQFIFACLVLWIISIFSLSQLRSCSWPTLLKLIGGGVFSGLSGIFDFVALHTLSVSLGTILFFQYVWMGILLEWFLLRRTAPLNRWIALVFVSIGTPLAAGSQALLFARIDPLSLCFGLLAAFCYAVTISVSGRVAVEISNIVRTALMVTGGTIVSIIVFPPVFLINGSLGQGVWIWGLLLALFGLVLPPFLLNKETPIMGVGMTTILITIELPVSIALAACLFSEKVQLLQWAGVVLIVLGIVAAEQPVHLSRLCP